jgi:hypothetical protein
MPQKLRDLPPERRFAAILTLVVGLILIGVAQRDISNRSDAEINGPKFLWRLLSLNALGAIGYFRFGRRSG